ncbi:MAG: alginate export family protein [Deltaproteobacteria bacterium]|nr:alginate export family protein [Deltaproteobacteria bacterium]
MISSNPAYTHGHDKINLKGYLFDARGAVDLGPTNIHVKGIYASGDGKADFAKTGDDWAFFVPGYSNNVGGSINNFDQANWAEIMGCGMFDYQFPSGSLGTQISNAIIGGVGASYKLIQDLKFSADVWYAQAADSIYMPTTKTNSDYYGTELDLKVTYMLVDNLKLDLVGAYLWAGDVISKSTSATNSANPIEIGAQMSLAF